MLNCHYGAKAAAQRYLQRHVGINPNLHLMELKFHSVSSGSEVAGVVNADDVEIFGRVQSGLKTAKVKGL